MISILSFLFAISGVLDSTFASGAVRQRNLLKPERRIELSADSFSLKVKGDISHKRKWVNIQFFESTESLLDVTFLEKTHSHLYSGWSELLTHSLTQTEVRDLVLVISRALKRSERGALIERMQYQSRYLPDPFVPRYLLDDLKGVGSKLECESEWVQSGFGKKRYRLKGDVNFRGAYPSRPIEAFGMDELVIQQSRDSSLEFKDILLANDYFCVIGVDDSEGEEEGIEAAKMQIDPQSIFSFSFDSVRGRRFLRTPKPGWVKTYSDAGRFNFRVLVPSLVESYLTGGTVETWLVVYGEDTKAPELERVRMTCQAKLIVPYSETNP